MSCPDNNTYVERVTCERLRVAALPPKLVLQRITDHAHAILRKFEVLSSHRDSSRTLIASW